MASMLSVKDPPGGASSVIPPTLKLSQCSPISSAATTPSPSLVKPELPTPTSATPRPPLPTPPSDADVVHIPSYSRWFCWNRIHECELRFLPEFFDSRSPSKNPSAYMYFRNSILKHFRRNPSAKITFTDVRKTLVGDVGSIRRVFDFLEAWGLINYSPSALSKPLKWEDKDNKSTSQSSADGGGSLSDTKGSSRDVSSAKRLCSGCKSVCSIACFACDKYDLTLCARCYVRGNYRVGVSSSDFRRVEISEDTRTDWTEKETLQLLEALLHYGDDWRKVAQHVGGRSEKDCIIHFIKLPFGEEFSGYMDSGEVSNKYNQIKDHNDAEEAVGASSPSKKMRLTPLADASNPIMAQAAFLSAVSGANIAEAAAQAAVTMLTDVKYGATKGSLGLHARDTWHRDSGVASNGDTNLNELERACLEANSLLEKEEVDRERVVSSVVEVQMKEIQEKIAHFEQLDLQMEKEWGQLEQMKNLLFADQLSLLFHFSPRQKTVEQVEENARTGQ